MKRWYMEFEKRHVYGNWNNKKFTLKDFFHNGQSSFNLTPDRPVKEISKCRGTDCYQGSTRESLVKGNMQWMVNWDHNSYNLAILDQKTSPWVTLFPYKLYLFVATIRMKYRKNKKNVNKQILSIVTIKKCNHFFCNKIP